MNIKILGMVVVLTVVLAGGYLIMRPDSNAQKSSSSQQRGLVIYSGRKEPLILPIIKNFEKETGVKTILKSGSTEELANLLLQEGEESKADIFISTDASLLQELGTKKMLAPIVTEKLQLVPKVYRAADNTWTGVSGRSRVLIVNTDLVKENEFPESIYDITNPVWKGKVAMAKMTNESVVTHMSAIKLVRGEKFLSDFLDGLKNNDITFLPGHTDVRQAVARGEFAIGFVNHYYGHLQQQESENIAIVYTDQDAEFDGTFVNVSGAGIIASAKNSKEAQDFIEYLLRDNTQKQFAELNFEYPLVSGIQSVQSKNLGDFRQMEISLHEVSKERAKTIELVRNKGL